MYIATQDGGGGVDRHRGADLVERDAVEHLFHVGERVDGDADLADLGVGDRVVGVVADLRRQVEGDGEAGLALREQELEALVGLLGGAEAGVLAHGPEAAAVHGRLDAAREGVLAGVAEVAVVVEVGDVERRVEALDGDGAGAEVGLALGEALEGGLEDLGLPAFGGLADGLVVAVGAHGVIVGGRGEGSSFSSSKQR